MPAAGMDFNGIWLVIDHLLKHQCQIGPKTTHSGRDTVQSAFPVKYLCGRLGEGCYPMKSTLNDMRDTPAYTMAEAARYLRLPSATLRDWVVGRSYSDGRRKFAPLIKPAGTKPSLLSFHNLIEGHILRSLRTDHGITIQELRKALTFAEHKLGIERLLLSQDLCTHAGSVFLKKYGELIELSNSGQLAMQRVFEEHLKRVTYDSMRVPVRLFPFLSSVSPTEDRPIAIDPNLAFGRPVVLRKAISTSAIVERIDAGEGIGEIAADYDLNRKEVEQAIVYERAA